MPHTPIVRHPELSKMTYSQLLSEMQYSFDQGTSATIRITNRRIALLKYGPDGTAIWDEKEYLPFWKLQEDLAIHNERLQAIVEELKFRQIP